MNVERHVGAHIKLFQDLVKGDGESAAAHRKFYDEYLSVMDVPGEFYLQTVERIFQKHDLALGKFTWHGQLVRPETIKKTALLVIEGELDDISAPGQTRPAIDLCSGLDDSMKKALSADRRRPLRHLQRPQMAGEHSAHRARLHPRARPRAGTAAHGR